MFLDHTQRRSTVGRTPLDKWSAHNRDLYLTTHNTHNRQTSMPQVVFEPTISAGERPQTYALDRPVTGTGERLILPISSNVYLVHGIQAYTENRGIPPLILNCTARWMWTVAFVPSRFTLGHNPGIQWARDAGWAADQVCPHREINTGPSNPYAERTENRALTGILRLPWLRFSVLLPQL